MNYLLHLTVQVVRGETPESMLINNFALLPCRESRYMYEVDRTTFDDLYLAKLVAVPRDVQGLDL